MRFWEDGSDRNVSRTLCLYKIAGGFQADARMSRLRVQPVQSLDGTLELFMTHDGTDVKLNLGLMVFINQNSLWSVGWS